MRIFLCATSLSPAYGGPARSVSALARALADAGLHVGLWAADGSALTTPFLPASSSVCRLQGDILTALDDFGATDIIHDNGIWMPHNHQAARAANSRRLPRIVSTRGMLEPWALNHKKWKKRLAWTLYQQRDLRAASHLHATAQTEADNIARLNLSVPVSIIPNGIELPGAINSARTSDPAKRATVKTALFVGRIHPVKGLAMLIEAWSLLRPAGWKMRIVGPDEGNHKADLITQIKRFGLEPQFEFTGELEGANKEQAFSEANLFILPSHSENFGIAIGEALARGLPVITTKGAPWQLLETEKCGWWTPISPEGIGRALADASSLPAATLAEMGYRGRNVVIDRFAWPAIAGEFVRVYERLLRSWPNSTQ